MNQLFKGDVTNNVVELNLQAGATNIGTPTVAYDGASNGVINQITGDVPPNWENSDSSLYGLVIGTSCTAIGSLAFYYCTGLTGSLVFPDSVTSIGDQAFDNCTGFTGTLTFGNGVTVIGSSSFYDCTSITSVSILATSAPTIGSNAFNRMTSVSPAEIHVPVGATGYAASYDGLTVVYDL